MCSCRLSLSVEGTCRLSETEETERLRKTPSWSPSEEKQHFLCLCISLFAFPFSPTSDEDFLRAPAADSPVCWRRGRTMRREGECGTVQGGAEREIKEQHTHMHYANRSTDTGVHEDTHTPRRDTHTCGQSADGCMKRGKDRDHNKTDIKPGPMTWEFPPVSQCHTSPNLTECRWGCSFLNMKDSPLLHWVIMRNVPSACTVGLPPPLLLSGPEQHMNSAERTETPDLLFLHEGKRMWGLSLARARSPSPARETNRQKQLTERMSRPPACVHI